MNKKKALTITGIAVAIILIVMIVLPFAFKGKISRIVQKQAEKRLLAKVTFTDLSLNLFSNFPNITASLSNLAVVGIDSFATDTLIYADKIQLSIDFNKLISSNGVSVKKIELIRPRVLAKVLPSGKANWDIVKPDTIKHAEGDTSVMHFKLERLILSHANIVYDDQQGKMRAEIKDWSGDLSGDLSSDKTLLATKFDISAVSFAKGGVPFLNKAVIKVNMEMDADMKNNTYTFRANRIQLNAMDLSLNGYVQLPDKSTTRMNLALNTGKVTFKQLLSLIPAIYMKDFKSLKTSGNIKLAASVKGDMTAVSYPAFDFTIVVDKGVFQYPSLPKSVNDININAHIFSKGGTLDNIIVDVPRFHFNMAGNPFDLTACVKDPESDPDVNGSMKGSLNLNSISQIYPLDKGTNLKGQIYADISAAGRLSYLNKKQYGKFKANGNLTVTGINYKSANLPEVSIKEARMEFTPRCIVLTAFSMMIGKNDIQATGELNNMIAWFMRNDVLSGSLNVTSKCLNINDLMKESGFETVTKKDTIPVRAFSISKNLNLSLNGSGKKVLFNKLVMDNVKANMLVKDGRVTFKNLSANALGGTIGANGYYEAINQYKPQVALGLNLKQVSFSQTFTTFSMVKSLAPIFENIDGNGSLDLSFNTTMDKNLDPDLKTLSGSGVLQSQNVRISNVKVLDVLASALNDNSFKTISPKDLKISFKINDGKINTSPFDVNAGNLNLNLSGSTGLDKTIDYVVKVTLPQNLVMGGINNFQGTITGTFSNPKINIKMSSIAKQAAIGAANQLLQKAIGKNIQQTVTDTKETLTAKAEVIRAQAKTAGDKLILEAETQGNALVNKANNPIVKAGAQITAKKLKSEAQKKAAALNEEAENKIKQLSK